MKKIICSGHCNLEGLTKKEFKKLDRCKEQIEICPHLEYCVIKDKDCYDFKNCPSFSFYNRYKEMYNFLGV